MCPLEIEGWNNVQGYLILKYTMTTKTTNGETLPTSKTSVEELGKLLAIIGFFLFFAGWVYLYYFYDYFGLSLSIVSLGYSDYIVYSFTVLTSYYFTPLIALLLLWFLARTWLRKYLAFTVFLAALLFLGLFYLAKNVAKDRAFETRTSRSSLRRISFLFNEETRLLNDSSTINSFAKSSTDLQDDLRILRCYNDSNAIFLLGQNEDYYFVLHQESSPRGIKALPFGKVYFIPKNSLLFSQVIIK